MSDAVRELDKQMRAASALRESIKATYGEEDADLIADSIEGETGLFEAVDAALVTLEETQLVLDGLDARLADLNARKARLKERIDFLRTAMLQAMDIAEVKTLQRPLATLSMGKSGTKVVITNEAELPGEFWRQPDPVVDKTKLNEAMKAFAKGDGDAVPGAEITNTPPTLTIRRK